MRVEDRTQLEMLQRQCRDRKDGYTCRILVCAGTGCVATGSLDVYSLNCGNCAKRTRAYAWSWKRTFLISVS